MSALSVIVPTYKREAVLIRTVQAMLQQCQSNDEVIVVDQTAHHEAVTNEALRVWQASERIKWIRLEQPSITRAMNRGLLEARNDIALFIDDDIRPEDAMLSVHREAHKIREKLIVAGRVVQPWQEGQGPAAGTNDTFAGLLPAWVDEFMGGNFSISRADALALGGFDENFVQAAYRYEAEFAGRFRGAGGRIRFEPGACVHHLREVQGGTRSFGHHLTTGKPAHAVGAYYFALRTRPRAGWVAECLNRPWRAVATRHHLRAPWWIPVTLFAEARGFCWAVRLHLSGPKLIGSTTHVS